MSQQPGLRRVIGVGGVAFTTFNCIVGVGIFALPALVAGVLGPAAILAYGVCLVLIGLLGLCFAEAGSRVTGSGGLYAYASASFGPVAGGVVGALMLFTSQVASAGALARFLLDTLALTWPVVAAPGVDVALLVVIFGGLAVVNIAGTRDGTRLTVAIGLVKLALLALLVVVGVFAIQPANLAWPALPPVGQVGEGALILVFAFLGIETGLNVSGETREPARTIPRAIALALGMVAVLYMGLQLVAQGMLGPALATSEAPLVATAGALFGPWGARLFAILTLLSVCGYLVADMLASPRTAFALAEAGQLPRAIAWIHPRHRTPAVAIALYAVLAVLVAASGSFRQIATLAVAGTLSAYLVCCLGVLRLRAKGVAHGGVPFIAPGGALVPLAAAAIILWLLSTLARVELIALVAFVSVSGLVYAFVHQRAGRLPPGEHGAPRG